MQSRHLVFGLCWAVGGCGGIATGAADAGPGTPYVGYVNALAGEDLGAGFFPVGTVSLTPSTSVASLCASPATVSGECCYSPHVLLPPSQYSGVGAGTLTVSDQSNVIASMTPEGSAVQYLGTATQPWNPGDLLHVTASGGVIHPFEGSLQTPGTFVATPSISQGVVIDRSKDFVATWVRDSNAGETVTLYIVVSPGTLTINCQASDDAGQITIPAELLANTPAGGSIITNQYRDVRATVTADNATVYLAAATVITWNGTLQ
jgi:hypothetical protein